MNSISKYNIAPEFRNFRHPNRISGLFILLLVTFAWNIACTRYKGEYCFAGVYELAATEGLQDPFRRPDGTRVASASEWQPQREYLKRMLTHYQYGNTPPKQEVFEVNPVSSSLIMHDSIAEELFDIVLQRNDRKTAFRVGIRRPNKPGRFPVVIKNDRFVFDLDEIQDTTIREGYRRSGRGEAERNLARAVYAREYVLCKFNRDEVAADHGGYRRTGVFALYPEYDWGVIAAWAWAYSIIIDHLERKSYIDAGKIVATGHSRGGKTALCAGIYEERIAVTAPNSSGTGGTGSWRYFDPEYRQQWLSYHIDSHRHWWHANIFYFSGNEERLPFDAHFQKALIAPRGLINAHSRDDHWANPYGTYLTYLGAEIVYAWLGAKNNQGVHWRNGPHDQNMEDWHALFEFCDRYFFGNPVGLEFAKGPEPGRYSYGHLINYTAP